MTSLVPDPLFTMPKSNMAANMSESCYAGLIGLADGFLKAKPPQIKECIQCLQAVFQFHPSPAIQARTHIQIGRLLHQYTKNTDLARSHLEKAVSFIFSVVEPCSDRLYIVSTVFVQV